MQFLIDGSANRIAERKLQAAELIKGQLLTPLKSGLKNNMHVHIGRVNNFERFYHFHNLGAHTCDGSGISMYDHMLEKLYKAFKYNDIRCQIKLPI